MTCRRTATRAAAALALLVGSFAGALFAASASADSGRAPVPRPIATVTVSGGFCPGGCPSVIIRIGDRTISGDRVIPRRLEPRERLALLRAIAMLDLAELRRHPFRGTCPTAYDGRESTYRFRGFPHPLASCTYDLSRVKAVRLVERLLTTLRWR